MTVSVDDAETGGTLTDGVWQPRWDTRGTRSFIDTLVLLLKVGSGGGGEGWIWSMVPWRLERRKEANIHHCAGDTKNQRRLLLFDNDSFPLSSED